MFKKLITHLYRKYGQPDIVAVTRMQMLGTPQAVEVLDLPLPERKLISQEAKTLLDSHVLKLAFSNVKNRIMKHIQNEAPTAEVIFYDRFSINGVALIEDELNSYADFSVEDKEEFDPQEVF